MSSEYSDVSNSSVYSDDLIRRNIVFPMNSVLGICYRSVVGSSSECGLSVFVRKSSETLTKFRRIFFSDEMIPTTTVVRNLSVPPIPTNFWRFCPSVSACFLVLYGLVCCFPGLIEPFLDCLGIGSLGILGSCFRIQSWRFYICLNCFGYVYNLSKIYFPS